MNFKFKLAKRLAIAWVAAFFAHPAHLPIEARLALLTLLALSCAVSLRPYWSVMGDRRRYQLPTQVRRRLSDQYPCWQFFIGCVVVRVAILAIPKVAT